MSHSKINTHFGTCIKRLCPSLDARTFKFLTQIILRWQPCNPSLSNAAPVIYFPGALIYSAGFNVNQNFKEQIFLNNSMFKFFS
jgi:hypothetical protein